MRRLYILLIPAMIAFTGNAAAQTIVNALPVLVSANATVTWDQKVLLSWTVLQKIRTGFFYAEKSCDGITWRSFATIQADNNAPVPASYNILDPAPFKGAGFYRICIKDLNGGITFTAVKNVRVNSPGTVILYPNPSSTNVAISLGQPPATDWTLSIYNNLGQFITQHKYNRTITMVNLAVDKYPKGNYIVEINDNGSKQRNTLMINHK